MTNGKSKTIETKSNLSKVAQEVAPYLDIIHKKMLAEYNEITDKNLIDRANMIITMEMNKEDASELKVDFRITLAKLKSDLLVKEQEKRARNIIANYFGKLDSAIAS